MKTLAITIATTVILAATTGTATAATRPIQTCKTIHVAGTITAITCEQTNGHWRLLHAPRCTYRIIPNHRVIKFCFNPTTGEYQPA